MSTTYRVVIKGVKDGFAEEQVVTKLSALFKGSEEQARKILLAESFPVKKGIDLQTAEKYQVAIEVTGSVVIVEPEIDNVAGSGLPHKEPSICSKCGSDVSENTTFCGKCGTKINSVNSQPPSESHTTNEGASVALISKNDQIAKGEQIGLRLREKFPILAPLLGACVSILLAIVLYFNSDAIISETPLKYVFKDSRTEPAIRIVKLGFGSNVSQFKLVSGKVVWDGKDKKRNPSYVVRVEYDAPGYDGRLIRTCYLIPYIDHNGGIYDPYSGYTSCGSNNSEDRSIAEKLAQHYFISGEINYRD